MPQLNSAFWEKRKKKKGVVRCFFIKSLRLKTSTASSGTVWVPMLPAEANKPTSVTAFAFKCCWISTGARKRMTSPFSPDRVLPGCKKQTNKQTKKKKQHLDLSSSQFYIHVILPAAWRHIFQTGFTRSPVLILMEAYARLCREKHSLHCELHVLDV